jgi:hypothetical protein
MKMKSPIIALFALFAASAVSANSDTIKCPAGQVHQFVKLKSSAPIVSLKDFASVKAAAGLVKVVPKNEFPVSLAEQAWNGSISAGTHCYEVCVLSNPDSDTIEEAKQVATSYCK